MSYELFDTSYACPCCDTLVQYEYECPGYSIGYGKPTMVCVPPCGGAIEFTCPDANCDWWFRHPNNRDVSMMGKRPEWIGQALKEYFFQPDVWRDDDEEEPFIVFAQEYISLEEEDENDLPLSCGINCEYCGS